MSLILNILNNLNYLKQDYLGIHFNFFGILGFFTNIMIPLIIIFVFYLIGLKINNKFFEKTNNFLNLFISIALGYISICTILLLLGIFGLLYSEILYFFYGLVFIIAIFPLKTLTSRLKIFPKIFNEYKLQFSKNKLINIAILCFILISFLRLIPPEVGVDAIWYHTDYPKLYLNMHSMMNIDPRGQYYPAVTPTLSDMIYVFTISISAIESSRFIHFIFYLLVILEFLILFGKRYSFAPYAALLFVTSPIVIRVSSSAYAEFQWVFCWLLVVFMITAKNKHKINDLLLPSILIGGALATKLWFLPFFGAYSLYILVANFSENKIKLIRLLCFSSLIALSIPFLWYLRAYIITSNPLFPAFWSYSNGNIENTISFSLNLYGLKSRIFSISNISPLSLFGFIAMLPILLRSKKLNIKNNPFLLFVIITTIVQLVINYSYHRFVIPYFSILSLVIAYAIDKFVEFKKYFKYLFYLIFSLLFLYYFLNTLLILPYGLAMANQNNYLSRILSRDASSYYDYNYQFSKFTSNKDIIATYGVWGFYYGNFNHFYIEDLLRNGKRNFKYFKTNNANKLIILGGDINWFCKKEKILDCDSSNYKLLTYYNSPALNIFQYLYLLK